MRDARLQRIHHAVMYDEFREMAGSRRISNPFYFGDLALDEAFTDRREELESLESDMQNGRNVALIAPRRYGKSSLVRRATQELVRKGVLVAEVDLMKTPTKERFASHLARAIHDGIASPMFPRPTRGRPPEGLRLALRVKANVYEPRPGRRLLRIQFFHCVRRPGHRRHDRASPGAAGRGAGGGAAQAGRRLLRRVPGRDRHRPAAPRAHAGGVP